MQFRPKDTITEALRRAGTRPANTVWLILSIEGFRYYVFFSEPNLRQLMTRTANHQAGVNLQLQQLLAGGNLSPSNVRVGLAAAGPPNALVRYQAAAAMAPRMVADATARGVVQPGGHAEMFLIEAWQRCVGDFINMRNRSPKRAEIFLSHSPCRADDASPSPATMINGVDYPLSCRSKLYTFFKTNSSVKWKIWYAQRFGTAEGLTDEELTSAFPNIAIERMSRELVALVA